MKRDLNKDTKKATCKVHKTKPTLGVILKIFSKFSEKKFKLLLVQITDKIKRN